MTNLLAGVTAQLHHERGMARARGKEPMSMRLVPQVPMRHREEPSAWIGGGARLPPGMAWPEIDGSALQPLAQIDCAWLPPGLWGGLGPRHGWLAIFIHPRSLDAKVLHFADAGAFRPAPPILADCNIASFSARERVEASGGTWAFPCWPADIVRVADGANDPRREGRSEIRHKRHGQRHDIVDDRRLPLDWPMAQGMMNAALAAYERMVPRGPVARLSPEALARSEQAIIDAKRNGIGADELAVLRLGHAEARAMAVVHESALADGAGIVERLRALKEQVDFMAERQAFSAAALAPILDAMKAMTWTHKGMPPFHREGRRLSTDERCGEGVKVFALPLTTHDPSAVPSWAYDFETRLLEAAKLAYLSNPAALPAALVADCEEVWRDEAAHAIAGMGHVPWGYVHEFDDGRDVTLLEMPSSNLIGWMFGDVYNLLITVRRDDLSRNDFSRPLVQITN